MQRVRVKLRGNGRNLREVSSNYRSGQEMSGTSYGLHRPGEAFVMDARDYERAPHLYDLIERIEDVFPPVKLPPAEEPKPAVVLEVAPVEPIGIVPGPKDPTGDLMTQDAPTSKQEEKPKSKKSKAG